MVTLEILDYDTEPGSGKSVFPMDSGCRKDAEKLISHMKLVSIIVIVHS